ncbi:MAG: hypothetical protein ACI9QA_000453 [Methanobacteriota archaeon]|jgi:hypothetical protein
MRRITFVLVLLVGLAGVTGCLGGEVDTIDADISPDAEPAETNETGDEILASGLSSTEDVDSYTVESTNGFAFGASQFFNANVSMESNSRFSTAEQESIIDTEGVTDFSFLGLLDNTTEFETTVYSEGNTTRRRTVENGNATGWSEADANYSLTETVFGTDALSWMRNGTEAELLGEERVNGVDTYALRINVTRETYRNIFMHSTAAVGLSAGGVEDSQESEQPEEPEDGEFNITDETAPKVYLWVDKETRRPARFAYLFTADSSNGSAEGDGGGLNAAFSMLYEADYSYEEVEVEPPEGL